MPLVFSFAIDAAARDPEGTAQHQPGPGLRGALHPGGGAGAGAGADERERLHPGREGRHRRPDRQLPVHGRVRQDPVPAGAARHRRAPRRHAAPVPAAGRDAGPGGPAQGHLRHRHPRRGHQRADPHRAVHRAVQVRRDQDPAAAGARVPPDRRAGGPGGVRRLRAGWSCRPPSTWWRTRRPWPRRATIPRRGARWCARSRPRAWSRGASRPSSGSSRPTPSR